MKILAVFAHPNRTSFTGALLDAFVTSATAAGHTVDVLDLNGDAFDPIYNLEDQGVYYGVSGPPADVAAMHKRVLDADAMAFFFPIWWWSMPAILKGWVDRVFTSDFAFTYEGGNVAGLLKHKKVVMFCPAASDQGLYRRYGYHSALQRQVDAGIFGFCGITNVETHILPEVDDNEEARLKHLEQVRSVATSFDENLAPSTASFS